MRPTTAAPLPVRPRTRPDPGAVYVSPETARQDAARYAMRREHLRKCDGCGEWVPASLLEARTFIRGLIVRTCKGKGKGCFKSWKAKNGR